jgi:DNA anti-recombination protein RmuC
MERRTMKILEEEKKEAKSIEDELKKIHDHMDSVIGRLTKMAKEHDPNDGAVVRMLNDVKHAVNAGLREVTSARMSMRNLLK